MILLLPAVLLFLFFIFLFIREVKLDCKRCFEEERLADEYVLREVEKFVKEQESKHWENVSIEE